MSLNKTRAALAALKYLKASRDRHKALLVYDSALALKNETVKSVKDHIISNDILEAILDRMERAAERYHFGLSVDQPHSHLLQEGDILLSELSTLFRIIRRLNDGLLATDELYELESKMTLLKDN